MKVGSNIRWENMKMFACQMFEPTFILLDSALWGYVCSAYIARHGTVHENVLSSDVWTDFGLVPVPSSEDLSRFIVSSLIIS